MNSNSISGNSSAGWEPPSPEALHALLPQYEITGILGRGGMGAVYKGRQTRLDRDIAIKVLPEILTQQGSDEMKFAERFELEARAMAKFNHPNIVSVFDFGETSEGQLYFVMEFVEGMDIHQYLQHHGGKLPQEHALSITAYVLDALEYAHARGIVHRDIKPANILLDNEGQVKIADFGLAKALTPDEEINTPALTMTNMALGTPDFVAPEALDSDGQPDHRADLYAVGVMLYQMLTGKLPRGQFKMPADLLPELDPRLDDIVNLSLQSDPDERFSSAIEMRQAMNPVISAPMSRMQMREAKVSAPEAVQRAEERGPHIKQRKHTRAKGYSKINKTIGIAVAAALTVGGMIWFITKLGNRGSEDSDASFVESTEPNKPSKEPINIPNAATREKPFENSLGMRFVPVPITGGATDGMTILFSIWETRRRDYQIFIDATKFPWSKADWRLDGFEETPLHPAVEVSWHDANAFCDWLTKKERQSGNISESQHYRLPTDHEWSNAAGIGDKEDPLASPGEKSGKITWGSLWPPSKGAGNLCGEEMENFPWSNISNPVNGFRDNFPRTAPVGSFAPNELGLFDLVGNVWEWCEEKITTDRHTLRGHCWYRKNAGDELLISHRSGQPPKSRTPLYGFRVVLDADILMEPKAQK